MQVVEQNRIEQNRIQHRQNRIQYNTGEEKKIK